MDTDRRGHSWDDFTTCHLQKIIEACVRAIGKFQKFDFQ